ncbi:RDD family protein [Nakamurella sp. YIM 132087]|uniref:RDD family protein n=1 Tax=Nakamurella alba TaxID=2665158 RepID=A0A7K1FKY1_9ACTN|nr:RDD family protein [Nakamurella alba]MTD13534.1 RDD family protein [Nakamurella alba]
MSAEAEPSWPGRRLGLPETGVTSVAGMGSKVGAFLIDIVLAGGIALLFTRPELPRNWSLITWAVMTVITVAVLGYTPGQGLLGIRVAPLGRTYVGLWAIPRTALIFLVVPPLVTDPDGRGWHDRLCRTVVVRMR